MWTLANRCLATCSTRCSRPRITRAACRRCARWSFHCSTCCCTARQSPSPAATPSWRYSNTPHTFSHIFAGGYSAGYYSYKWAEVLSADAYAAFEEAAQKNGHSTLDVETGRRYREAILEAGGSRPAMASFKAFRGREPGIDALLRHQGMA